MLDQQKVGATSLNAFKNGLDKLRKTKMGLDWTWRIMNWLDCPASEAIQGENYKVSYACCIKNALEYATYTLQNLKIFSAPPQPPSPSTHTWKRNYVHL